MHVSFFFSWQGRRDAEFLQIFVSLAFRVNCSIRHLLMGCSTYAFARKSAGLGVNCSPIPGFSLFLGITISVKGSAQGSFATVTRHYLSFIRVEKLPASDHFNSEQRATFWEFRVFVSLEIRATSLKIQRRAMRGLDENPLIQRIHGMAR